MRSALKTVRLREEESRWVGQFLKQNQAFAGFSDLARLAILDFIQRRSALPIRPVTIRPKAEKRPSFLWDYDLDTSQIRTILAESPLSKKAWLIGRILEQAPYDEIWEYLTPEEIGEALPALRIDPKRKAHWEFALGEWAES